MGYQLPSGPTKEERHDFYVSQPGLDDIALANLMEELDKDVEVCRVASHAGGTLWVLFNLGKMSRHSELV